MAIPHAHQSVVAARHAAASAEKLSQARRTAAAARTRTEALQIKAAVAFGCVMAGALGFGIYRASLEAKAEQPRTPPPVAGLNISTGPATPVGEIQLPVSGEVCQQYQFDNRTGIFTNESKVICTPIDIRPTDLREASRTQALMNAFKFK